MVAITGAIGAAGFLVLLVATKCFAGVTGLLGIAACDSPVLPTTAISKLKERSKETLQP